MILAKYIWIINQAMTHIGTKHENNKESFKKLQKAILQYAMENNTKGRNLMPMIWKMKTIDIASEAPENPMSTTTSTGNQAVTILPSDIDRGQYKMDYQAYHKRVDNMKDNMYKLYSIVWGQCTSSLQEELQGLEDFELKDFDFDVKWLLQSIQLTSAGIDKCTININESVFAAVHKFYTFKQQESENCDAYLVRYTALLDSLQLAEINVLQHEILEKEMKKINITTTLSTKDEAIECYKAVTFILSSDPWRFSTLIQGLKMDALKGIERYPTTMTMAYDLLNQYEKQHVRRRPPSAQPRPGPSQQGMQFLQAPPDTVFVAGSDGRMNRNVQCWNPKCGAWGHMQTTCPLIHDAKIAAGASMTQFGVALTQQMDNSDNNMITMYMLLFDSCSTMSGVNNSSIVHNIHPVQVDEQMRVISSGGHFDYHQKATLNLFDMPVYFNKQALANTLSLKDVANKYRVTMDTNDDKSMTVWIDDNKGYKFKECRHGLYSLNITAPEMKIKNSIITENPPGLKSELVNDHSSQQISNYSFLSTVAANKEYFTYSKIQGADNAPDLQYNLGWPSDQILRKAL
jgi:hypothetical protein